MPFINYVTPWRGIRSGHWRIFDGGPPHAGLALTVDCYFHEFESSGFSIAVR